jgi:hypothetical protein
MLEICMHAYYALKHNCITGRCTVAAASPALSAAREYSIRSISKSSAVISVLLTIFAYRRDGALTFHVRTPVLSMAHVTAPAQCNKTWSLEVKV